MNVQLKPIAIFVLLYIFLHNIYAQRFSNQKRYYSVGGSINALNYVGELDPGQSFISPSIRYTRPNFGLTGTYRYNQNVSFRATLNWGRIKGNDNVSAPTTDKQVGRKIRNLNFRSSIFEVKADVIYDFFENRSYPEKRPEYTPYVFLGIAYFRHNPKGLSPDGEWVNLRPLQTEGYNYKLHQVAIPFGIGFRYKLAKQWDLAFEIGWRYTFTDYLDDVGGRGYNDPAKLTPLGRQMAFRSAEQQDKPFNKAGPAQIIYGPNGETFPLPDGSPLMAIKGFGGEYVINENGEAHWVSDPDRGDKNKDWYIISGFHLTYIIPRRVVCPKFRY
jgi:hypothetical protein